MGVSDGKSLVGLNIRIMAFRVMGRGPRFGTFCPCSGFGGSLGPGVSGLVGAAGSRASGVSAVPQTSLGLRSHYLLVLDASARVTCAPRALLAQADDPEDDCLTRWLHTF